MEWGWGAVQGAPSQHWQPLPAILGLHWGAAPCQMAMHGVGGCLLALVMILACGRWAWDSRAAQMKHEFGAGGVVGFGEVKF